MNKSSGYDDFVAVIDSLTQDFDRAYVDVPIDVEPMLFSVLSKKYGLAVRVIKRAWESYLLRRQIGRPMLGPSDPNFKSRDRVCIEEMSK